MAKLDCVNVCTFKHNQTGLKYLVCERTVSGIRQVKNKPLAKLGVSFAAEVTTYTLNHTKRAGYICSLVIQQNIF